MNRGFEPGFGATLAAAREAKGLTRAEVAERLKLSPRQIEALEAEDWGALPDPVFVRGFVRNYARLLGLDADALIARGQGGVTVTQTITAPSAGVRLGGSPVARWLILPLLLAILFVSGVAALYTWLRQGEDTMLPLDAAPKVEEGAPAATPPQPLPLAPEPAGGDMPDVTTPTAVPRPPTPSEVPMRAEPVRAPEAPSAPVSDMPTSQAAPGQDRAGKAETVPADPGDIPKGSMRFTTAEDAWIQVVDSKGMRYSKLVRAGSSEVVSGTPPFKLVVGNAANVNLVYNGHTIDLKPFIGEKVARLTLE